MSRVTGLLALACALCAVAGCASTPTLSTEENVVQLTHSDARNGQPFWSPDQARLSFVSNRDGRWQIWVMDLSTQAVRRLTNEDEPPGWPSWSVDGSEIFFYGLRDGEYRLLSMPSTSAAADRPAVSRLAAVPSPAFRPLQGPDGRSLLFDAVDRSAHDDHELYVLESESGRTRRLTHDPGYDSDARWSPDGREIVFHSDRGRAEYQTHVYRMAADGSGLRQLSHGEGVGAYPAWSPNGRCVVYTWEVDGNRDLWVVDADGENPRRLTSHPGFDSEPVWSPGGRIVFSTDRFGGVELATLDPGEELEHCRLEGAVD